MSYKAEIELAFHLHTFKNIQIDRQGYAAIRVQIYDESAPNLNYALPYNYMSNQKKGVGSIAGQPSVEDNAFHGSTVKIQYADEKYFLNEVAQFKLLIQSVPKLESSKIYLKLTLLFCTLHSYSPGCLNTTVHGMQSTILRLQNIESGIFHYYETQFGSQFASSVSFTLFSMITDFKLFPYSMRKEVIAQSEQTRKREIQREKISEIEDLFMWSSKYIKNCKEPIKYFYRNFAKVLRYNSFLLKTKIYQSHKISKKFSPKLPKFARKGTQKQKQPLTSQTTPKQFYSFFLDENGKIFDLSKITIKDYKEQIVQLHQENYFFAQEVGNAMAKGLIDEKKLQNQFKNFMYSQNHGRIVRDIKFGQQIVNTSHAYETIAIADKIRKQRKQQQPYPILPSEEKVQQYLFYQICYSKQLQNQQIDKLKTKLPYSYDQRNMLIFLCHGFQASSYDMRLIQRGIKEALPLAEVIVSCANESDTDCDIDVMGRRLADQVHNKIKLGDFEVDEVILNFVGHSMGGIIARASLKYLKQFKNRLGFFCSLSSPHIGYMNGTDSMIKAGLWFMKKMMKQNKSLSQLQMTDGLKPEDTFLYNLSTHGQLVDFKKIILISSAQDSYVPWHSARICAYDNKKSGKSIEGQMADRIIGDSTIHRIDVNFACSKNDLDGFIGRKAHINLILNESIFKLINAVIPKLFDIREL